LDFGFGKTGKFSVSGGPAAKLGKPEPVAEIQIVDPPASVGGPGVQFGAFATAAAAKKQQDKVQAVLGAGTYLEKHGGLIRVRAKMSDAAARNMRAECASKGMECFVFH
jgi:hypothetical protein